MANIAESLKITFLHGWRHQKIARTPRIVFWAPVGLILMLEKIWSKNLKFSKKLGMFCEVKSPKNTCFLGIFMGNQLYLPCRYAYGCIEPLKKCKNKSSGQYHRRQFSVRQKIFKN